MAETSLEAMTMVLGELYFNHRMTEGNLEAAEKRIETLMKLLTEEQRVALHHIDTEGGNA